MIPIRLTIKGIYSYQQEQTIDFADLTSANLFGIFGQVGSGKSTILEAISFALYGETERLNQKDNRSYNMMNLKSNEMFIDFTFKNGKDNDEYRFKVSGKRNKNNFEKTSSFSRDAYRKTNGDWQPIEPNSIDQIIGLSYENFKRTIIIPQGKFQEFLQLGNKDRTQMLKELFNLDKYELFYQVVSIEKKNKEKQQNIEGQLLQVDETSPEIIEAEEKKLRQMATRVSQLDKSFQKQQKAELALQKLKELFEKASAQKELLAKLENETESYQELESKINDYELCLIEFRDLLARKQEFQKKVNQSESELEANREQFNRKKSELENEEKTFEEIKDEYENRENLKRESDELNKIARIQSLNEQIGGLQKQIGQCDDKQRKSDLRIKKLKAKQKNLASTLARKKKKTPDTNTLMAVKEWFTNQKNIQENLDKLDEAGEKINSDLEQLESEKNSTVSKDLVDLLEGTPETKSIKEIVSDLEHSKINIEEQKERVEQEIEQLAVQEKLEAFAENLAGGQPCPLCGSKEHPEILDIKHVNRHLQDARQRKAEFDGKLAAINDRLKQLTGVSTQLDSQKELLDKNQKELDLENEQLKKHQTKFVWPDYSRDDEASVKEAIELANQLKKEIEEIENEAEQFQENVESEIERRDEIKEQLNELKDQNTQLSSESQILGGQLESLDFNAYKNRPVQELQNEAKELRDKVLQIENQYQELEERLVGLRKSRDTLLGTIKAGEKTLKDYQKSLGKTEKKLTDRIAKSKFSKIEDIESILQEELEVDKEKERISQFKQDLHTAQDKYKELVQNIKGKRYDGAKHKHLIEELESIKAQIEELNEEVGKQKAIIKRLAEALATREKLEKELDSLKLRGDDISTLKQLFKGSGFVNFVSTVYLQNLCKAANERFYQLTRKQLRLEISENNTFQVRDFLNEGKVRSIKTLSGGQTFQAALSLALSLAESIQEFNESKQNFFFLDEGFGSLDKEALQVVFDTLKSLQKENRIIGIISHVEDLQQEVDTYLKIMNDEENGSMIKPSWECFK